MPTFIYPTRNYGSEGYIRVCTAFVWGIGLNLSKSLLFLTTTCPLYPDIWFSNPILLICLTVIMQPFFLVVFVNGIQTVTISQNFWPWVGNTAASWCQGVLPLKPSYTDPLGNFFSGCLILVFCTGLHKISEPKIFSTTSNIFWCVIKFQREWEAK